MDSLRRITATASLFILAVPGYAVAQGMGGAPEGGAVDSSQSAVNGVYASPGAASRAPSAVDAAPSAVNAALGAASRARSAVDAAPSAVNAAPSPFQRRR